MKSFVLALSLFAAPAFGANCQITSTATGAVDFNTFNEAQQGCNTLIQQLNINNNECNIVNNGGRKRLKLKRARRGQDQSANNAAQLVFQDLLDNSVLGLDAFLAQLGGQVVQRLNIGLTTTGDCSQP